MSTDLLQDHVPPAEGKWKFKRQRVGDTHIEACESGYPKEGIRTKKPRWLEIHHLLCVHACSDSIFPDPSDAEATRFFKNCMAITEWCINDHTYGKPEETDSNLIGLPTKQAYVSDKTFLWDKLPCHQVDHDIYLEDVNTYVTDKIWKKLAKAKKEKACKELTPDNIKKKFTTGSKFWRDHLVTRGKESGGAKACLEYCLKGKRHPTINDQNWHIPFSMAHDEDTIRTRAKPSSVRALVREALLAIK